MISRTDFPRLTDRNHRITSPATSDHNCIAWAAGDTGHWWQPGVYWPIESAADDYGIGVLEQAFTALGFEECSDGVFEAGFKLPLMPVDRFQCGRDEGVTRPRAAQSTPPETTR